MFRIGSHVASRGDTATVLVSDLSEDLDNIGLGEFEFEVRHIPKKRLNALYDKHTKTVRAKGGGVREKLNRKGFFRAFVNECVVGWDNLTVGILKKLVALENIPESITDDHEIGYDPEQAIDLLDAAYHLEGALVTYITEPSNFVEDEAPVEDTTGN